MKKKASWNYHFSFFQQRWWDNKRCCGIQEYSIFIWTQRDSVEQREKEDENPSPLIIEFENGEFREIWYSLMFRAVYIGQREISQMDFENLQLSIT